MNPVSINVITIVHWHNQCTSTMTYCDGFVKSGIHQSFAPLLCLFLSFFFSLSLFFFFLNLYLSAAENSANITWVRLQQPQEQRYPFLTMRAVFSCV